MEAAGKVADRAPESLDIEQVEGGTPKVESVASTEESPDVQASRNEYTDQVHEQLGKLDPTEERVVRAKHLRT